MNTVVQRCVCKVTDQASRAGGPVTCTEREAAVRGRSDAELLRSEHGSFDDAMRDRFDLALESPTAGAHFGTRLLERVLKGRENSPAVFGNEKRERVSEVRLLFNFTDCPEDIGNSRSSTDSSTCSGRTGQDEALSSNGTALAAARNLAL